jgi:hypothetical protein
MTLGPRSVVIAAVVAPNESIAAPGRNIFMVETTVTTAKHYLLIAVEMFKMQLDQVRIVEIGRKIVTRTGIRAHLDDAFRTSGGRRSIRSEFKGSSCLT